jgi:hypothetical protein
MKMRVPAIKCAGTFFEAEFDLLAQGPAGEGGAWLLLRQIRAGNLLDCSNPAVFYYFSTGTSVAGEKMSNTCDDWTNGTSSFNGSSGRTFDRSGWTYSAYPQCDRTDQMHLYCFEDS